MEQPEYKGPIVNDAIDKNRWDLVAPRTGDIIVAVRAKMGTTWSQMLCALLVHGPELPRPLAELSPWLDGGVGRWKSNADFFRKGRRGEWREVYSPETQALYLTATRSRFDPIMLDWLENGRSAAGDPRDL